MFWLPTTGIYCLVSVRAQYIIVYACNALLVLLPITIILTSRYNIHYVIQSFCFRICFLRSEPSIIRLNTLVYYTGCNR